jgi:hypothetical protein
MRRHRKARVRQPKQLLRAVLNEDKADRDPQYAEHLGSPTI